MGDEANFHGLLLKTENGDYAGATIRKSNVKNPKNLDKLEFGNLKRVLTIRGVGTKEEVSDLLRKKGEEVAGVENKKYCYIGELYTQNPKMNRRNFLKGLGVGVIGGAVAGDLARTEGHIEKFGKYLVSEARGLFDKRNQAHDLEIAEELGLISGIGIKVDLSKYSLYKGLPGAEVNEDIARLLIVNNFNFQVAEKGVDSVYVDELRPKYMKKVFWANGVEIGENEKIEDSHFGEFGRKIMANDYKVFLYGDRDGNCLPKDMGLWIYMSKHKK